jgi:hypothetical protein
MENSGLFWTEREELQLKKLFCKYNMDISEIAEIHKRSCVAIKARLIKLGLMQEVKTSYINLLNDKIKELEEQLINLKDLYELH